MSMILYTLALAAAMNQKTSVVACPDVVTIIISEKTTV
jgi:hypothetical protein